MTLNEAGEMFGISIKKLKYYEECGFLEHKTLADGTFDYTEAEIRRAGLIHFLLSTGMNTEDLKKYLRLCDGKEKNTKEQIRMLRKQRCLLLDDIHCKQQVLDELDYMIVEAKTENKQ